MTPAATTSRTPAATPSLGRRLRQFGIRSRRLRRGWTRQRMWEIVRSLAYVIPLTLLIWLWAQDQQIDTRIQQSVPVTIAHSDPQKVVTILGTEGEEPVYPQGPTGQRIQTSMTLQGPRIGLNTIGRILEDPRNVLFDVRIQSPVIDQTTIPLRTYLNASRTLQEHGVSVAEVTPSDLVVRIEERRQATARLEAGGVRQEDLAGPPVFDPPAVEVSGAESVIRRLERRQGEIVLTAQLPEDVEPGEHEMPVEVLLPEGLSQHLQVEPKTITARFTRRQQRVERMTLPAVAVYTVVPGAMSGTVVEPETPVINNVVIEGPADLIARIQNDRQVRDEIRALLYVDRADLDAGEGQRPIEMKLPPGVSLVGDPPVVGFTLRRNDGS